MSVRMNSRHETVNIFRGLSSSKLKHRKWESLLDKADLLSRNTFHIIAINQPACIWQAPLVRHHTPIELILLKAVLTRPGPIYFTPFQCTFKFHLNSISLLLGRKQHWLISSSSWRCPLNQWARGTCLRRLEEEGSSKCCSDTGHSIHICLLHIGSMWTQGGGWCVQIARVIKEIFFSFLHTFSYTLTHHHHASMRTDGLWSFNGVRNYNLYAND